MKRLLFVIAVLSFAGMFLYSAIGTPPFVWKLIADAPGVDLTPGIMDLPFPSSGSGSEKDKAEYLRISPISGVAYAAGKKPKVSSASTGKTIEIGTGLYFFHLNDLFENVAVSHESFRISQIERGAFYVDSRNPEEIKVFSVSALLNQELLTNKKKVTDVTIFPSTYFGYSPKMNDKLANADLLRLSQLNVIRYVDAKIPANAELVFGTEPKAREFFADNLKFGAKNMGRMMVAFNSFVKLPIPGNSVSEEFGWYFVNPEKRASILKWRLLRTLQELALAEKCDSDGGNKCPKSSAIVGQISSILNQMRETGGEPLINDGRTIVRTAYYIASARLMNESDRFFVAGKTSDVFANAAMRAFPSIKVESADYVILSAMYSAYYFGEKDTGRLERYLDTYVSAMVRGKTIRASEFLPFSFFLKEYLRRPQFAMTPESIRIASNLITVSNEYYAILRDDGAKFSILSFLYMDVYPKILRQISSAFWKEFLTKNDNGIILVDRFVLNGDTPNLPEGYEASVKDLVGHFDTQLFKDQRANYFAFLKAKGTKTKGELTAADLLDNALKPLRGYAAMLADYPQYLQNLKLSDESRNASGISSLEVAKTEEDVREYFSQFKGVDADTLKVTNDFEEDGFYQVTVTIADKEFEFRYFPNDRDTIDSVVISEYGVRNERFSKTAVPLDEKKEDMDEKMSNVDSMDPRRDFYVFENFFINTYLTAPSQMPTVTEDAPTVTEDAPTVDMDKNMLVFVDRELINKDFKNIANVLPINISNITASIDGGDYDITLNDVRKNGDNYVASISGKYVFKTHEFYRLNIQILNGEGTSKQVDATVETMPRRIPLANMRTIMPELDKYAEVVLSRNGRTPAQSVVFDFSRKKVILDGTEYDLPND